MNRPITRTLIGTTLLLATACSVPVLDRFRRAPDAGSPPDGAIAVNVPDADTIRPRARATSAAPVTATGEEVRLGETVVGLDATRPGAWLLTPLVTAERPGRVVWKDNGNSIAVTLLPKDPASGEGSLISLEAMRALGLPLGGLATLIVYGR